MSKDPGYSDSKRDALESKVRQYQSTILELQEKTLVLGKLQAENAKLKECVEFYAGTDNWLEEKDRNNLYTIIKGDASDDYDDFLRFGGKRARQVLKELDENK